MKTENAIDSFNYLSMGITCLLLVGMIQSEPILFKYISFFVKCMVGISLMYKFNDFREKTPFTQLDKKLCFLAGTYIVLFTIGDKLKEYGEQLVNIIQKGISPT
jgi:hypothetical protein